MAVLFRVPEFLMSSYNETSDNSTAVRWFTYLFPYYTIVIGIFYVIIFILGVIGNGAVFYIISCRMRQSATSIFLLNLSIADMMMAMFCVPATMISDGLLHQWVFGRILCHIIPFIQGVSVFLSAFTHTAISMDRYFVVFHPLRRQNFPMKGAVFVVTCMWIFSVSSSIPVTVVSVIINSSDGKTFCQEKWPNEENALTYSLVVMVLQYFLPLFVIVMTYSAIAIRIWFYQTPGESIRSRDEAIATSKKKMIKMFIIVAVFYSLSQLPRHIIYLTSLIYSLRFPQAQISFWNDVTVSLLNMTHVLSMSACFYNPILYIWLNSSFRKSLKDMLNCHRVSSLPPTSPKCMNAFPDVRSSKKRMLSISSNNALLSTKLQDRRFL